MKEYFYGWYFKCQSKESGLAIIPALHKSKDTKSSSVQIITSDGVYNANFPYEAFSKRRGGFGVNVKDNRFFSEGIDLDIQDSDFNAVGTLKFGELSPIKYDIMGPFKFVPFMECRHSVASMKHTVSGELKINGTSYSFDNDVGYIEGDRGSSFPREYAWTHCFFEGGSVMLSVARIPFGLFSFTGIIGVIMLGNKEYRIATYLGAKILKIEDGEIIIKQGKKVLKVKLIEKNARPLFAPNGGKMTRTIHESLFCSASYTFKIKEKTVFSFESNKASFEYEFPKDFSKKRK